MQTIYEEEGVSRLFVYRWLTTMNCQEEYEMWSNTLRSALGVFSVGNQNDPDIVLADNVVTGRNTVLTLNVLYMVTDAEDSIDLAEVRYDHPWLSLEGFRDPRACEWVAMHLTN